LRFGSPVSPGREQGLGRKPNVGTKPTQGQYTKIPSNFVVGSSKGQKAEETRKKKYAAYNKGAGSTVTCPGYSFQGGKSESDEGGTQGAAARRKRKCRGQTATAFMQKRVVDRDGGDRDRWREGCITDVELAGT